jgi:hypothetical protein
LFYIVEYRSIIWHDIPYVKANPCARGGYGAQVRIVMLIASVEAKRP